MSAHVVSLLALAVVGLLMGAGLLHLYWAIGGRAARGAAVPEVSGRAAFTPSRLSTAGVSVALFAAAFVVCASSGYVHAPISAPTLSFLMYSLGLVFLARAIGEFHLVGFFKRVRGTAFARLDTLVYSPVCLFLGAGILIIASSAP